MSAYVASYSFVTTYPYASGLYSQESKLGPFYPIGELERVTEASVQRVTEDGKIRITE